MFLTIRRATFVFIVAFAAAICPQTRAAEEIVPAVEIRVQSLKTVCDRIDYFAEVLPNGDQLKPVKGLLNMLSGGKALDSSRPFGAYAFATANLVDGKVVLLIPIGGEKEFSERLASLKLDVKKDDNDVFTVRSAKLPMPILYRVIGDYVYATVKDSDNINEKTIIDAKTFFKDKDDSLMSVKLRLDAIPADVKKTIFGQVELGLSYLRDKKIEGEAAGKKKLRDWGIERILSGGKALIDDGKDLTLRLGVDPKTDETTLEASFTARSESDTAKSIREAGSMRGTAASLAKGVKNPIAAIGIKAMISENAKKELAGVIDELIHDAVEEAKDDDKEGSRMFWNSLLPTLKSGDWELGATLVGPDAKGKYSVVAAAKTAEGKEIESLVKTVAGYLPDDQFQFDFDVKKIGGILRHDITVKNNELEQLFGSKTIVIGTHDDAFVIGFGPTMKGFTDAAERKEETVRPITAELSVARFLRLTAMKDKADFERKTTLVRKIFKTDNPEGTDSVRFTLDAGDALTARLVVKGKAMKLIAATQGK